MHALWLKLLRPRTLHLTRIFKSECGGVGEAESSVRSAMFIATTRSPGQAPEERHVSWLGDWPVSPTPIGTCRSYGAWLNSGGLLAINIALLTELPKGFRTEDPCKVQPRTGALHHFQFLPKLTELQHGKTLSR